MSYATYQTCSCGKVLLPEEEPDGYCRSCLVSWERQQADYEYRQACADIEADHRYGGIEWED